jgi:hypothetical protein
MNSGPVVALAIMAAAAGLLVPVSGRAQAPMAVVEDINGSSLGIRLMDYVVFGQVIELGARDTIVLGYMDSCVRETITGGTVTIGRERSDVKSGSVERTKSPCVGGHIELTEQQANQSAAMVYRDVLQDRSATKPRFTLYSTYPIIEARGGGSLQVTRIDRKGETIEVTLTDSRLMRGLFYDFRLWQKPLAAGGIYRATLNGRSIVFKVDGLAARDDTVPIIGRLLRFTSVGQ